ncbi:hypothetical protein CEK71_21425 [Methylovulum psychrotolerans]|uniref:Uncharacterized protein n=2 Tax=Methylovulum psychrotolerans TaxID=1704499 RepID=A0A1Z4C4D4_9GAMM|nr:hypothetical protein CEK71_21425 [Methylovulum psychrotolerans]
MRLWCHVWVPEFETDQTMPPEKCNAIRAKFPNWGDAWAEWKDLWTIKDEEEAKASLVAFLKVFDKFVLPWFDSITTGDALLAAAGPHAEVDPIIKAATSLIKEKYSLPSSHELFMLDGNRSYMAYGFAEADRVLQDKLFDIQVTLPEAAELPLRLQPSFGDAKKQPTKLGDVHRFMGKARLEMV